jgi:hypothetical protein
MEGVEIKTPSRGPKAARHCSILGDIEMDDHASPGTNIDKDSKDTRMIPLYGINRPFFHPNIQSAVETAVATEDGHVGSVNEGRSV